MGNETKSEQEYRKIFFAFLADQRRPGKSLSACLPKTADEKDIWVNETGIPSDILDSFLEEFKEAI